MRQKDDAATGRPGWLAPALAAGSALLVAALAVASNRATELLPTTWAWVDVAWLWWSVVVALTVTVAGLAAWQVRATTSPPLSATHDAAAGTNRAGLVPRQLPGRLAEFTGRQEELARLHDLLDPAAAGGSAVVITAIDGLGGIGKSTLALEAAWRLAERFPDGQLYLDLHGSTPGLEPLEPLPALTHLLRSLGVQPTHLPSQVEEAAAQFRTLTSGRRLLLVLDNARDAAQVRPLLPGHPGCAVVITSRATLAFLDGVTRLPLDALPEREALELLSRVAGPGRVQAEPEAAARLVRLCGRLPLAIQISGRRLGARPAWRLDEYATRLADEQARLDELQFGDRAVRSSFEVSYQLLARHDPQAAGALRLLSLPDGPDITIPAAAALIDQPTSQVRTILENLVDTSLLTAPGPDRYRLHDLVRLFGREHATSQDPQADQDAALRRAFGFYTATAWRTVALLRPGDRRVVSPGPRWTNGGLQFADAPAALAWLDAERDNLLATIQQAAATDALVPTGLAAELTRALFGLFDLRSHWQDWIQANQTILELGRRTGDRVLQAHAANDLGAAYRRAGRYAEALESLRASLAISRELGDHLGEANSLNHLGLAYEHMGRYAEAIEHLQTSLRSFRHLGDRHGEANTLTNLGIAHRRLGRSATAVEHLQTSLEICRQLGDRRGEAYNLDHLGVVYEHMGRYAEAIDYLLASLPVRRALSDRRGEAYSRKDLAAVYERVGRHAEAMQLLQTSLTSFQELGDRRGSAMALRDLGDVLHAIGQDADAHAAWQDALALCEALQIPEADELRARLAGPPADHSTR